MTDEVVVGSIAAEAGWGAPQEVTPVGNALATREDTSLKVLAVLARQAPRDEPRAYTAIIQACRRPGFAEVARYAFPRGGSTVSGPSVTLARMIAQRWGNIRAEVNVVSCEGGQTHLRAFAHDLETNTYIAWEDVFKHTIQRKNRKTGRTEEVEPNERELRELTNKRGAILMRNVILQVVPFDVIADAEREVQETMRAAAAGELQQDRSSAVRRLAVAFNQIGVTTQMLEDHLGHSLEQIDEGELADLRGVFLSIRDGHTTRKDHFDFGVPRAEKSSEIEQRLTAEQPELTEAAR